MHVLDKHLNSQYSQDTSYPVADVLSEIVFQKQDNLYTQDHENTHRYDQEQNASTETGGCLKYINRQKYLDKYLTDTFCFIKQ